MKTLIGDIVFSFRQMWKLKGVSAVVILSISFGVSVNSVTYSWVNALVLNPLPAVPAADQLYSFKSRTASGDFIDTSFQDFVDLRDGLLGSGELFAYKSWPANLSSGGINKRVFTQIVSSNYFQALRLSPELGRFFSDDDLVEVRSSKPVVIISYQFWKSRYQLDNSVIGQSIQLNKVPFTIIGISPKNFSGVEIGGNTELWLPLMQWSTLKGGGSHWIDDRKTRPLSAMARVENGAASDQFKAKLDVITTRLQNQYPRENAGITGTIFSLASSPNGEPSDISLLLFVLYAASFMVLLIICANLVNLMLAKLNDREKELGIRISLGASGKRIFGLFLVDGLVYGAIASVVSIVAVKLMIGYLAYLLPDIVLRSSDGIVQLSQSVIFYTASMAFLTGLLMNLIPAYQALKIDPAIALKEGSGGGGISRRKRLINSSVVAIQIAMAFLCLTSAWMFVDSFNKLSLVDTGFVADRVQIVSLAPSGALPTREESLSFVDKTMLSIEKIPLVTDVAVSEYVPLGFSGGSWEDIVVQGYTPGLEENMKIYRNFVSENYFQLMGIDLLLGRAFSSQDNVAAKRVAIVNQYFTERYFSDRNPIGRIIEGWGRPIRIVGVAGNSKYRSQSEDIRPYLYLPFEQFGNAGKEVNLHIKRNGGTPVSIDTISAAVNDVGSVLHVNWTTSLNDYIKAALFGERLLASLMTMLGIIAAMLSGLGIYGVVSNSVVQRKKEIGIRAALGANDSRIIRLILTENLKFILAGLVLGVTLFLLLWDGIRSLLFEIDNMPVVALSLVVVLLATVAIISSLIPAIGIINQNIAKVLSTE